jgi:uncharacterized protein (TIGR02246 family)
MRAKRLTMSAIALAAVTAGCSGAPAAPAVDAKAEEQAIRRLDEQWLAAAEKKDVEAAVAFYAPDATALWPDAPAAKGTDAIRKAWTDLMKVPNVQISFTPEHIEISQAGDLATDVGTVSAEMDMPQGHVKEDAKYLVVWKKVNGSWKAQYDMFNLNAPAPAQAAPAPGATTK